MRVVLYLMSKHTVDRPSIRLWGPTSNVSANHFTQFITPMCFTMTPFGLPVDPDVYSTYARPPPSLIATCFLPSIRVFSLKIELELGMSILSAISFERSKLVSLKIVSLTTIVGGTITPRERASWRLSRSVIKTWHFDCANTCVCLSGGNDGSTGTNAV